MNHTNFLDFGRLDLPQASGNGTSSSRTKW